MSAPDIQQVRGLKLLLANPNYDLDFYDESLNVAVESQDANYIKSVIGEKIRRSSRSKKYIKKFRGRF